MENQKNSVSMVRALIEAVKSIYRLLIPKPVRARFLAPIIFEIRQYRIKKSIRKLPSSCHLIVSCAQAGEYENLLYSKTNRKSTMGSPVLCDPEKGETRLSSFTGSVPDVFVYRFKNAEAVGSTDSLIFGGKVLHYELSMFRDKHDLKRPDIFSLSPDKKSAEIFYTSLKIYDNPDTLFIHGLKEHSINYYHWLTEEMPRLITIFDALKTPEGRQISGGKKLTVLLDEGMPPQCIEALKIAVDADFNIEYVPRGVRVRCREIIYCTPFWLSLDNTRNELELYEFFVDSEAVAISRNAVMKHFPQSGKPHRKIYMKRRTNQMRSIINNAEVEKLMASLGFELVETGGMSFREQVELFSQAKIIAGASGAAFTNLLFMRDSSSAVNFYPSHKSTNYYVFQPLAECSGTKLIHFLTTPGTKEDSVHSDFYVKLDYLEEKIKQTEGCRND